MKRIHGKVTRGVWAGLAALSLVALAGCGGAQTAAPKAPASHAASTSSATATSAPPSTVSASSSGGGSSASSSGGGSSASTPVTTLTVATPAPTADFAYVKLANDLGYLKPYHIHLQVASMNPPTALAALESGKIAFVTVVGSSIDAALRGLPVRVVFIAQNYPDWLLMGGKGISSVAQLKGKTVGGNVTPNDTVTVSTEQVLQDYGLPKGEYTLRLLGQSNPAAHLAALQSGAVQATMLDIQTGLKAHAMGYPILERFWPEVKLPNDGLVTSLSEIKNHPAMVEHVLAACSKAVAILHNDPSSVYSYLEKDYRMTPAAAKQFFSLIQNVWTTNGIPSNTSLQGQMKFVQQELKLKTTPSPSQAYDFSLLRKALG